MKRDTPAKPVNTDKTFDSFILFLQSEYWSDVAGNDLAKQKTLKDKCLEIINQLEEYAYS